jgi:hypothetical protein
MPTCPPGHLEIVVSVIETRAVRQGFIVILGMSITGCVSQLASLLLYQY